MGVDAMMFVRTEQPLNDVRVRRLSYELTSSVGHEHFLIWEHPPLEGTNPRHALSIIHPLTKEDIEFEEDESLIGKIVWFQDGAPIIAKDGEQFIQVNLNSRYYGPGYERGDFPVIYATACWLRARIEGEVWYGGDSSGVCAGPFDFPGLMLHWIRNGRRPYVHHVNPFRPPATGFAGTAVPHCNFCDVDMAEAGGGRGVDFWSCDGCGKRAVTFADGSATRFGTAHQDWHQIAEIR